MLGRRTYACRRAIAAPMSSPAALRWLGSNSATTELEYMRRACQVQRWHCQRRSFGRTPDGRSPSVREVTLREAAGLESRPPWWPKPSQRKPRPSPRVQQSRTVPTGIQEDGSTPGPAPAPAPAPAPERVAKRLARVGLCSRREADEWITAGRLTVNGTTATPGTTVTSSCELLLDGKSVANASPPQIFLYHKPRKVIVTRRKHRDENRRTIADELTDLGLPDTLKPVGRLDYMTSGLMLLTNDGELAHGLELSALPRTYLVKAYGGLHRQKLTSLKRHGRLRLPAREGMAGVTYSGVKIRELSVDEVRRRRNAQTKAAAGASRRGRDDGKSTKSGVSQAGGSARWMEVTLIEGKNHEVRHIIAHLGLSVSKLERVRFGPYDLHWLQPGDVLKTRVKDEIKEYVGPGWNWV